MVCKYKIILKQSRPDFTVQIALLLMLVEMCDTQKSLSAFLLFSAKKEDLLQFRQPVSLISFWKFSFVSLQLRPELGWLK